MAKKTIRRPAKKPETGITEEEMVHGAEEAGLLEHDEAEEILHDEQAEMKFDEQEFPEHTSDGDEADVKRPELTGEAKKPKFEQPGTNNQSRIVHDENN